MKKFKSVVIGLGNIGMMYDFEPHRQYPSSHAAAYMEHPEFELICAVDPNQAKYEILKKISGTAAFTESVEEAIERGLLKEADVVSICTPPSTHLPLIKMLLECCSMRMIFCEKPLAGSLQETEKLLRLLSEYKEVIVMPNISRRWNKGIRNVSQEIFSGRYGNPEKIHVRYTRGIYNTGAHLFDLLRMWTVQPIARVLSLNETKTAVLPEKSFSFYFEQENGITGYAEAVDDSRYYIFEIDLYLSGGKIEMRNSGDDVFYYTTKNHYLFEGYKEFTLVSHESGILKDSCIKNAVENISRCLKGNGMPACTAEDAYYPMRVAEALERSYKTGNIEEVRK